MEAHTFFLKTATNIWNDISLQKGIKLVVVIYILGMLLQEAGSIVDRKILKIYKGMNQSILKGKIDNQYKEETTNIIFKNPLVLKRYRRIAKEILKDFSISKNKKFFENDFINGYVFTVCQYYVSIYGKDRKVEKIRALFAMSKTLIPCFFILSFLTLISILTNAKPVIDICNKIGLYMLHCIDCGNKIVLTLAFASMGVFFIYRSKRVMRNFLLILLGTYDALVRSNKKEKIEA